MGDEALKSTVDEAMTASGAATVEDEHEEMPHVGLSRDRILLFAFFAASAVAFLYFVLPKLSGLDDTWNRLDQGDPVWLGVAVVLEALSFLSYVALFRAVFVRGASRIGWRESYEITMAGVAATRLFAAAGAGGIALTAWALRSSGLERRIVACRMVAFMTLLYSVYMGALVLDGVGLRAGVLTGAAPFAITVIPALFGGGVLTLIVVMSLLPSDFEHRMARWTSGEGRPARLARKVATAPASVASGVRTALALIRERRWGLVGALGWWAFDIAVLWACFHAFGQAPPPAIVVMGYFVGTLANVLPLPGGIGGVEGGMIGTFAAFHVDAGLALVAVLTYRGFSFWLPTVPGAVAYLQLRRTVARWRARPVQAT